MPSRLLRRGFCGAVACVRGALAACFAFSLATGSGCADAPPESPSSWYALAFAHLQVLQVKPSLPQYPQPMLLATRRRARPDPRASVPFEPEGRRIGNAPPGPRGLPEDLDAVAEGEAADAELEVVDALEAPAATRVVSRARPRRT